MNQGCSCPPPHSSSRSHPFPCDDLGGQSSSLALIGWVRGPWLGTSHTMTVSHDEKWCGCVVPFHKKKPSMLEEVGDPFAGSKRKTLPFLENLLFMEQKQGRL